VATGDARRLSCGAIGPGLERVRLAAFVPLHDAEQRGHAGVSAASSDLPDLRPVEARPQFDPSTALIVADLQNDFADPAGSLAVSGADRVILAVNAAVAAAVAAGGAVALTQDWHPESTPHFAKDGGIWPVHCVGGTWGAELHPAFDVPVGAHRVRKGEQGEDGYSGFTMRHPISGREMPTELELILRRIGIERVVVVGLATDYCVKATALDAVRLGFEVGLLRDAVAAVNLEPDDGDLALADLAEAGVRIG
jgi:nicotinamidase/pyrazinamidase